jgi:uncharacterized protein (DUF1501 family)
MQGLNMQRRHFLKSTAAVASMASLGAGVSLFSVKDAMGQAQDYKALVYVYMTGGNDGFNCFVPLDEAVYSVYNKSRGVLAMRRSASDNGAPIGDNGFLLPLAASNLGMHSAMAPLQKFWDNKTMAVVTNVGPLVRPIVKTEYEALVRDGDTSQIPSQLFDHGGQQNCWHNAMGDPTVQSGWGARALESAGVGASYSFAGDKRWGQSGAVAQLRLSGTALKYENSAWTPPNETMPSRLELIKSLVTSAVQDPADLVQAWGARENSTIEVSETIGPLLSGTPPAEVTAGFAGANDVEFVRHLKRAATIIAARGQLKGVRDIICVGVGDFDTHADQINRHPTLLKEMAQAVAAFSTTMANMGLGSRVTCMSATDFGRSLAPNSSNGTDHAWGNCNFVIGGAVHGQKVYGTWPDYTLGGPDDKASGPDAKGSFIPSTSVNQYAATVLKWFLPQANLVQVLPDLKNFSVQDLGFMKPAGAV